MGKKYIVEIGRLERLYKAYNNGNGMLNMTWLSPEVDLTPYTEPDLEQVRCEAYEEGRNSLIIEVQKAGKNTIKLEEDEYYQRGLADAWEAARTLWNTPNRKEIFGHTTFNTVLTTLTAQEAIEKIRQYEQEKKEQIQVGDEVKCIRADWTAVVTKTREDGHLTLMGNDGAIANGYDEKDFIKTGRHFHEIAEVLRKMKETES